MALTLSACTSAPTKADFARYDAIYRAQAQPELEQLERDRAAGNLTADQYADRKRTIEDGIADAATQAVFTNHQLNTLPPGDKDVFARPHGITGSRTVSSGGGGR